MPLLKSIVVCKELTKHRQLSYQFTPKHHGGDHEAAQWLPDLTLAEEFAVFNSADEHDLADVRGWLYGIWPSGDELVDLGTCSQQIAEFPSARLGEAWHGYPIWAVNKLAPANRQGEKMRPDKEVFARMEQAGLLTRIQRKRLLKGAHV